MANAGVCSVQRWDEVTPELWDTVIGINLTGVWNTCVAAIPHLLDAGGGSIILISSVAGLKGQPFLTPYVASKHGLVGDHAQPGQRAGLQAHPGQLAPPDRGRHPDAGGPWRA